MTEVDVGLLRLLCDQGKIAEAEALVDRYVARLEWELQEQARAAREALADCNRRKTPEDA